MYIVTDGAANFPFNYTATLSALSDGISIIMVGVGDGIKMSDLLDILTGGN